MWKGFVDDTFVVIKAAHKQEFLDHINYIDHHIQFRSEDTRPDGSMPFLAILVTLRDDGRLSTTVYRKPTHTDLYLQWDNHHTMSSKLVSWALSIIGPKPSALTLSCYSKKTICPEY